MLTRYLICSILPDSAQGKLSYPHLTWIKYRCGYWINTVSSGVDPGKLGQLCVEDDMLKPMIAATAVLVIAGSSTVYAQQYSGGPGGDDGGLRFEQQYRPSADDIKAFTDARIAALRAGLELTPDQEKNWPPFEQAVRDLVKLRVERIQAREAGGEQQSPANPFDRLQHRADAMSRLGAALKRVADAGAPLYQSLSDAQQHRFKLLAHFLRPHWMGGGFWQEHREFGNDGRGGPGGYFERRDGGSRSMMGRDRDDGGSRSMMGRDRDDGESRGMMGGDRDDGKSCGMMGRDRNDGGSRGMMGRDRNDGGSRGMMGRDRDDGGSRGTMGRDRDEDPDDL